jgi:hypothetical protein
MRAIRDSFDEGVISQHIETHYGLRMSITTLFADLHTTIMFWLSAKPSYRTPICSGGPRSLYRCYRLLPPRPRVGKTRR